MSNTGQPPEKPQPTTRELPAVDPILELLKEVRTEVRAARADINLVSNDLGLVKERVGMLETRVVDVEGRTGRNSNRVREVSQSDLEQNAQLAHLATKTEEAIKLATANQTAEILAAVKSAAATPLGKQLIAAGGKLLVALLMLATGYLMKGHVLP